MSSKFRHGVKKWMEPRLVRVRSSTRVPLPATDDVRFLELTTRLLSDADFAAILHRLGNPSLNAQKRDALRSGIERAIAAYQIAEQRAKHPGAALTKELRAISKLIARLKAKLKPDAVRLALEAQRTDGAPEFETVRAHLGHLSAWVLGAQPEEVAALHARHTDRKEKLDLQGMHALGNAARQRAPKRKPASPEAAFLLVLDRVYRNFFTPLGPGRQKSGAVSWGADGLTSASGHEGFVSAVVNVMRKNVGKYGVRLPKAGTLIDEWKKLKRPVRG